jgi:hypothetical protein
MLILVFLFVISTPPHQPPDFPKLPEGFTQWEEYHLGPLLMDNFVSESYIAKHYFWRKPIEELSLLPYTINTDNLDSSLGYYTRDSLVGQIEYFNPDSLPEKEDPEDSDIYVPWCPHHNILYVLWAPHREITEPDSRPQEHFSGYVSYNRKKWEPITIDNLEALRIRGRWWNVECDGTEHIGGSFTNYYIPTLKVDFYITCWTHTYSCGKVYPDRIAELERAVEQTFRVK